MTSANDYPEEMPATYRIDDATAEELLAGRAVPADLESVSMVLQALREVAEQPVPASAELAARMATGDFAAAVVPPAPLPVVEPRLFRIRTLLRRLILGGAGRLRLAARLAIAGVAVGVVGVGTAGFAGSLPPPAQGPFESVVESVTPYRFADRTGGEAPERVPSGPGSTDRPAPTGKPTRAPGGPPTGVPADPPGADQAPGPEPHDGTPPGLSEDPPGLSEDPPGLSEDPPGSVEKPPGLPGGPPGPPGNSGNAPGREQAPGQQRP